MDYEVKRPLMERIDKSLLEHAVALSAGNGGPTIKDVYQLQGLAEIHYYLKVEHEFTPDEVAVLLQFSDPLPVAMECWEEQGAEKGFPICALLRKINAWERFPLVDPEGYAQREAQRLQSLKDLLDKNVSDFNVMLMGMDKAALMDKSAEIAAVWRAHSFMKEDFSYTPGDVAALLAMENPLKFIAGHFPPDHEGLFHLEPLVRSAIQEAEHPSQAAEKPSVRGQLHDKIQEADQQPPRKGKNRGGEAR